MRGLCLRARGFSLCTCIRGFLLASLQYYLLAFGFRRRGLLFGLAARDLLGGDVGVALGNVGCLAHILLGLVLVLELFGFRQRDVCAEISAAAYLPASGEVLNLLHGGTGTLDRILLTRSRGSACRHRERYGCGDGKVVLAHVHDSDLR
ncbi:MAG: hypothetical protein WDO12_11960 [Pseudomonadota bacterium]